MQDAATLSKLQQKKQIYFKFFIDVLETYKISGINGVISEIFKYTQDVLGDTFFIFLLNYILEKGDHPEKWDS